MSKKECIAMLLAGGQGSRLGALTQKIAKPAVSFGGKFRIIDFSLSNCSNSGIDTVGVLTQYRPYLLHAYVGSGEAWDLDSRDGGVSILPPYETQTGGAWYAGTADAITQNLDYIKANDPKYVLILSGDHLYRMDYRKMLKTHIENNADLTVSVMPVPWEEASRFGIITKDPDRNSAEVGHTITAIGNSSSYDNVTSANASLVTDSRKAGLYVYGQNRHRSGYDHDGDGFTEIPQLQSQSLGLRSFFKTSAYSRITLQYNTVMEYRRGGDRLDLPPHEAMIAEQTDHNINGGSLSFDLSSADFSNRVNVYASFQHIARKSYYGSKQDPDAYGRTHDLTVATGAQYIHSFDRLWFLPADLTLGVEYNYNDLDDESIGYDYRTKQKVHIIGAYLQNEWKNEHWSLLIGGRLDKHSLVDHVIFSPRANLRYNPGEGASLRLSYSSGFRAPQAFDEDMHIAIVGGERVRIRLADDLREERSHSLSLSADLYHRFGKVQTNLLVEGFYTTLDHVFALRPLPDPDTDGSTIKERYNGSGARVMGINIEGKAAFTRWFDLQAGITLQQSRYKEPEQWSEDPEVAPTRKMFRTPNTYGYLTAELTPVRNLQAAITGTYTGKMLVQHMAGSGTPVDRAVTTPRFFDLNLKVSYDVILYKEIALQLHAGIQNIFNAYQKDFDRGANRDSGYIYGPSLPRSWFVGAKISF